MWSFWWIFNLTIDINCCHFYENLLKALNMQIVFMKDKVIWDAWVLYLNTNFWDFTVWWLMVFNATFNNISVTV